MAEKRKKTVLVSLLQLLPTACVAAGALGGYAYALRCGVSVGTELRRYLDAALSLAASPGVTVRILCATLIRYLRAPAAAFLFGFASLGVFFLPLLCALFGFVLSFSLCCFALALGRAGMPALLSLFALRLLVLTPCMLLTSGDALIRARALWLLSAGGGLRKQSAACGTGHWYRFALVCLCLALGALAELFLTPLLLAASGL